MPRLKNLVTAITDHPIRHVTQNSLLRLPGTKSVQEWLSTSTGANDKPNYWELMCGWSQQVIDSARAAGVEIKDAVLAEVGPGHSLGVAVALLMQGGREASALDVRQCADPSNPEPFRPLVPALQKARPDLPTLPPLEECLKRLKYAIVRDDGSWPVADGSVDILYSYFAGEHLRAPDEVLAETHRVLRPGGVCMYAIDLRDHIHRNGNWLQFLYYEPWLWEAMTSRRGQWSNRILSPQWRELFEKRFEMVKFDQGKKPAPADFDRNKLASPFKPYDTETLAVDYLWVVAKKK